MKKEKRMDILDKLIEDKLEENDEKLVRFKLFTFQIISLVIILFLLIVSVLNVRRSILFSYLVFSSTSLIPLVLYISFLLAFLYTAGVIITYVHTKNDNYLLKKLAKVYKKLDLVRFIDIVLGVAFFIIVFVITPCNVEGDSMNDTLQSGNRVITTDIFYFEPKNNDIITFDCSNYIESSPKLYIKRVIASKNSKVEYIPDRSTLIVDGKEVAYNISTIDYGRMYLTATGASTNEGLLDIPIEFWLSFEIKNEFIMPEGKVLVLGDNRGNSLDSRRLGAISTKDIFGHVLFRIGAPIETNIRY